MVIASLSIRRAWSVYPVSFGGLLYWLLFFLLVLLPVGQPRRASGVTVCDEGQVDFPTAGEGILVRKAMPPLDALRPSLSGRYVLPPAYTVSSYRVDLSTPYHRKAARF